MKFFLLILCVFRFVGKTIKSEIFCHFVVDKWKDFLDLSSHLLLIFSVLLDIFSLKLTYFGHYLCFSTEKEENHGKGRLRGKGTVIFFDNMSILTLVKMAAISFWSAIFVKLGNHTATFQVNRNQDKIKNANILGFSMEYIFHPVCIKTTTLQTPLFSYQLQICCLYCTYKDFKTLLPSRWTKLNSLKCLNEKFIHQHFHRHGKP